MPSFNKVIVAGNLTRDPEVRYTPKGTAVAAFGVAINRSWTTDDGEKREEVCFIDVTAFGRQAETIGQHFKKGRPIIIEGRLRTESWDDRTTGQKRSKLSVVMESFSFCDYEKREGDADQPARESRPPATGRRPGVPVHDQHSGPPPPDDDVPF